MKHCKACGREYRGKASIALVKQGKKLVGARVCPTCAGGATLLVLGATATLCKCGQPASKCHACATGAERKDKAKDLDGAITRVRGWRKMAAASEGLTTADFTRGKAEAFDSVLDMLENGKF